MQLRHGVAYECGKKYKKLQLLSKKKTVISSLLFNFSEMKGNFYFDEMIDNWLKSCFYVQLLIVFKDVM